MIICSIMNRLCFNAMQFLLFIMQHIVRDTLCVFPRDSLFLYRFFIPDPVADVNLDVLLVALWAHHSNLTTSSKLGNIFSIDFSSILATMLSLEAKSYQYTADEPSWQREAEKNTSCGCYLCESGGCEHNLNT